VCVCVCVCVCARAHQIWCSDTVSIVKSGGLEWRSNEMHTDFGRYFGKNTVRTSERIWRIM